MISDELQIALAKYAVTVRDEVALREILEAHVETFTLIKLAPWPSRRWKCRYRLLLGEKIHDAQSAEDAYALALLAVLEHTPKNS